MKLKRNYVVFIPARGGSKSIKNKNLQLLNGRSLIEIAIKKFENFDFNKKVYVSSDDIKILKNAAENNSKTILRPKEICNDFSPTEDAISHFINKLNEERINFDTILFHQCTSPLLTSKSIAEMINKYEELNNGETLFSVVEEQNPIWFFNKNSKKFVRSDEDDVIRKPRQERPPQFIETGGLYIIDKQLFIKSKNRFTENSIPFIIPKQQGIDIDNYQDLEVTRKYLT